jgi:hypothetical protein
MTTTVLLVTHPISHTDVAEVRGLHEDEPERFVVLVPVKGDPHRVLVTIDDIAAGDLADVHDDLRDPSPAEALAAARDTLETTVARLAETGSAVSGALTPHDPLEAIITTARKYDADEVVLLVESHAVEELFHRDWTSRARKATGLPTLHLLPRRDPDTLET